MVAYTLMEYDSLLVLSTVAILSLYIFAFRRQPLFSLWNRVIWYTLLHLQLLKIVISIAKWLWLQSASCFIEVKWTEVKEEDVTQWHGSTEEGEERRDTGKLIEVRCTREMQIIIRCQFSISMLWNINISSAFTLDIRIFPLVK